MAEPVAVVPYWTYLVPIGVALIGLMQTIVMVVIGGRVARAKTEIVAGIAEAKGAIEETKKAIDQNTESSDLLENKINSNMERQIEASIAKAIAEERLRVNIKETEEEKDKTTLR